MPFISPTGQIWLDRGEAKGIVRGRIEAIALGLRLRFGSAGLELMPRVQAIKDPTVLGDLLKAAENAPTLDALRALLPPEA